MAGTRDRTIALIESYLQYDSCATPEECAAALGLDPLDVGELWTAAETPARAASEAADLAHSRNLVERETAEQAERQEAERRRAATRHEEETERTAEEDRSLRHDQIYPVWGTGASIYRLAAVSPAAAAYAAMECARTRRCLEPAEGVHLEVTQRSATGLC